jgi:hypothetical protein
MAPRESERALLLRVARQAMIDHGLEPDFSPAALAEAGALGDSASAADGATRDLRALPWCSIDNDDSRDLDQLTVADAPTNGCTTIRVAVADVSATVATGSALDRHARANTTSVYTPPHIFPMLPDRLSTGSDVAQSRRRSSRRRRRDPASARTVSAASLTSTAPSSTTTRSSPITRSARGSRARGRCRRESRPFPGPRRT